ncbi:hypothetical protein D3C71_1630390 [compost metagenome]
MSRLVIQRIDRTPAWLASSESETPLACEHRSRKLKPDSSSRAGTATGRGWSSCSIWIAQAGVFSVDAIKGRPQVICPDLSDASIGGDQYRFGHEALERP